MVLCISYKHMNNKVLNIVCGCVISITGIAATNTNKVMVIDTNRLEIAYPRPYFKIQNEFELESINRNLRIKNNTTNRLWKTNLTILNRTNP